jgi:hypothetical protein
MEVSRTESRAREGDPVGIRQAIYASLSFVVLFGSSESARSQQGLPLPNTPTGPQSSPQPRPFSTPPQPDVFGKLPTGEPLPAAPANNVGPAVNVPIPAKGLRSLTIGKRSSLAQGYKYIVNKTTNEEVLVITGGVKLLAVFSQGGAESRIDLESDQLVVWNKGGTARDLIDPLGSSVSVDKTKSSEVEFYLAGNVMIRFGAVNPIGPNAQSQAESSVRAEEVYYNASKEQMIAIGGDLEVKRQTIPQPARVRFAEMWQISPVERMAFNAQISASKLPSDPGLNITLAETIITDRKVQRTGLFGIPFFDANTGDFVEPETQRTFVGKSVKVNVLDTPIFYFPRLKGDVEDPFGPLKSFSFGQNRAFGTQLYTTWDFFELLGIRPRPNRQFMLYGDYLSDRSLAGGTGYSYGSLNNETFLGEDTNYTGSIQTYGIRDKGTDLLGSIRETDYRPRSWRGRLAWRHQQTVEDWTLQTQWIYLSDPRFFEQYYKNEYDQGPNQESFAHLKYQEENFAGTFLYKPNLNRNWVSETTWQPKATAYWLGNSFFDRFTYNTRGSVGYAELRTPEIFPFKLYNNEQRLNTGRANWFQELALPLQAGALKIVPYGKMDLTQYTNDLTGESKGRFYGGGGVNASLPFSKLYPGVSSELLNVKGINHKITFTGNYYTSYSDTPYTELPYLDRLNDDSMDDGVREILPYETTYIPNNIYASQQLLINPRYNPQSYMIRRLYDNTVESLDTVQVLQGGLRQRWQTKRGYPGMEHTVDWMSLNLTASYFPNPARDNYGEDLSFLEYDYNWFIGDETRIHSEGWVDPFDPASRYLRFGTELYRPDRTRFNIAYTHIDPLQSRAVSFGVDYVFSEKYSTSVNFFYDFGVSNTQVTSMYVTRTGTDMSVSLGISYNAIINNLGLIFQITPNLIAKRGGGGVFNTGALQGIQSRAR